MLKLTGWILNNYTLYWIETHNGWSKMKNTLKLLKLQKQFRLIRDENHLFILFIIIHLGI